MSEPAKPWFRFRLATAVLIMFIAGSLIWKNLQHYVAFLSVDNSIHLYGVEVQGWPISFWRFGENPGDGYEEFSRIRLLVNIIACLGILILVAAFAEWLMRLIFSCGSSAVISGDECPAPENPIR